jgi:hypothetical protein
VISSSSQGIDLSRYLRGNQDEIKKNYDILNSAELKREITRLQNEAFTNTFQAHLALEKTVII